MNIGKGKSKFIVLRKKAGLIQRQNAEREAAIEARKEQQRLLEEAQQLAEGKVKISVLFTLRYSSLLIFHDSVQKMKNGSLQKAHS